MGSHTDMDPVLVEGSVILDFDRHFGIGFNHYSIESMIMGRK